MMRCSFWGWRETWVPLSAVWMLSLWAVQAQRLDPPAIALPPSVGEGEPVSLAAKNLAGQEAANTYCQVCHLLPDPSLVDKKTWWEQILPRMGARLGLPQIPHEDPEADLVKATGIFPDEPMLSNDLFHIIAYYYRNLAPEVSLPPDKPSEIGVGLKLFATDPPRFRSDPPTTTLVKISPASRRIQVGDDASKSLFVLDSNGRSLSRLILTNTPVSFTEAGQERYLTCIGSFQPSERRLGEVLLLEGGGDVFRRGRTLLRELPRTVHLDVADLNRDGRLDLIPCIFGNLVGRFSWFANLGDKGFEEDELIPFPGAIMSVVHDFNQDGAPDLAVLMAQALEALYIFYNDGQGQFTRHQVVFKQPPVYGHVYFELVDFNQDGRKDFLVSNGDNGEYTSPPKKYHGIRLYEDRGSANGTNRYEQTWFYPLNGAFKAMARDFDEDGDLDIAAISWFPDYDTSPRESFVYLENQGGMKFRASTFRECIAGRWIVMDVGDLDGDTDLDIVLGSYIYGPSPVPQFLMDIWKSTGPSIQILRNRLRTPSILVE